MKQVTDNLDVSLGNDVTMRPSSNAVLGRVDQYELLRELGGGGFGTVFLARDTVAGIEVAVKGLPQLVRNNREELESIRQNFALVSRLHHPHIAAALVLHPVKSATYSERAIAEKLRVFEGDTLMAMEYAPGVTLSQWRKQFPDGMVPRAQALEIVRQVADALDYAHEKKIIHRDIKPSNVMVETSGKTEEAGGEGSGAVIARVLDFGLAAEVRSSMGRVSREVTDTSGTRPYMAPEQWLGKKQNAATDQYALAVLAYELLTGEVPFASVFETGDPVVMMNVVGREPPEISSELPRAMRQAFEIVFAKDPAQRFENCAAFVAALSGRARTPSASRWIAIGAVALLAIVGIGYVTWQRQGAEIARQAEVARQAESRAKAEAEAKAAEANRLAEETAAAEARAKAEEAARVTAEKRQREAERAVEAQREKCQNALAEAERARGAAQLVGADNEAKTAFEAASADLTAASDALKQKSYDVALDKAGAAERRFDELRQGIVSGVLALAKSHLAAERWQECLAAAEKLLGWEPNNAEANDLKREAQRNLEPSVRVLAKLDGREVSAMATLDGESVTFPLRERKLTKGATWPESAVTVIYREGKKRFKGILERHDVDWLGLKIMTVTLKEIKEDGLYKVIDLTDGSVTHLDAVPSGGWTDAYKTTQIVLRRIEPGKIMMGSPIGESGRPSDDESKSYNWYEDLHEVQLTKAYYIGVFEVTQKQWELVTGSNPSRFKSPTRPVEEVSYDDIRGKVKGSNWPNSGSVDAESFLGRLRAKTGVSGFDLPTEAQWEYACRAGTTTAYSWGNTLNGDKANCDGNFPCGTTAKGPFKGETSDVGSYAPNYWGLYDMHGNVREWCADWYGYYSGEVTDPLGPTWGAARVSRGGGWSSKARHCRSANCLCFGPIFRNDYLGFRLCCSAGPSE